MALGPLFARHGYVFLFLFRRGAGLSAGEGTNSFDRMRQASAENGQEGRNRMLLELLERRPEGCDGRARVPALAS